MAVSTNDTKTPQAEEMSSGRRFAIGANVTIAVITAAALLVAVNWICSLKYYRRDIASMGNFGISERMKKIVGEHDGEIKLSLLYRPNEKDEKQRGYIERLMEYCDELSRFAPNVSVTHVATDSQREKLVAQIGGTFGGEAESHKKALDSFTQAKDVLETDLEQRLTSAQALLEEETGWLSNFPLFTRVVVLLRETKEVLTKTTEEIDQFTPEGGIPKYADATNVAKETVKGIKEDFENVAKFMSQFTTLADETTRADSPYIAMLRKVAGEAKSAVDSLRLLIGNEGEPPQEITAALKAYADRSAEVGKTLNLLVERVNQFGKRFPMVEQHANWATRVQRGPFLMRYEVAGVLQDVGRSLSQNRLTLLGVIDTADPEQLKRALIKARDTTATLEQNAAICEEILTGLADGLSNLDDASKQLLEAARGGAFLQDQIASLDKVAKELEALPELKLGSVADQLKEDNAVLVEANGSIQVVDFLSVWPVREALTGSAPSDDEIAHTFNGDSALSSAILSLTSQKPFATVMLVSFEPPAPQQQSPFMPRPPPSSIPIGALSAVKTRLQNANFEVVDWNLATQPTKPSVEEGREELFLLLPPAPPAPPNPFGGATPPEQMFNEKHRTIIRDLLDKDAKMLFLTSWEVMGGFGGRFQTPPYGYAPLLEQDWGIRVNNSLRMVSVEPDVQKEGAFFVSLPKFQHLPVNHFTDHPIGKPMRGTRFLVNDACSIETTDKVPEEVTTKVILNIPRKQEYIASSVEEIIEIINKINDQKSGGSVHLGRLPKVGPFDLMVAAERQAPVKSKDEADTDEVKNEDEETPKDETSSSRGKIVVCGFGKSLHDQYLRQPVLAEAERVRFDPPPSENLDLLVNTMYWLNDQETYIGRGPVPVPRIQAITEGEMRLMWVFTLVGWPILVLAPGMIFWYIRRR
ncbi:MAG: hypothetical protein MI923_01465 [Phycisphaerales bacterium]|nr:hypothetical protein [Phycisphaerales bacterium]